MRKCEICGREGTSREISFHHYYPRPFRKDVPRRKRGTGIYICSGRHDQLHQQYSNSELAELYHDRDSIYRMLNP